MAQLGLSNISNTIKPVLTNLLTNSQWMAMSTSTLENVGSDLVTNGAAWTGATGATPPTGWSVGTAGVFTIDASSGSGAEPGLRVAVNATPAVAPYIYQGVTTVIGKLYRLSFWSKDIGGSDGRAYIGTSMGSYEYLLHYAGAGATTSLVFEASTTTMFINLFNVSATPGEYALFDSVTLYEVTPGYVTGTNTAPDTWEKHTQTLIYRQHTDATYTKHGSFYATKLVTVAGAAEIIYWPTEIAAKTEYLEKFRGRTVTFGAWIYSASNQIKLSCDDGTRSTSVAHTGGSSWEWLEVTKTISAAAAFFIVGLYQADSTSRTVYFSQPMLVFGNSIGEGNYQPIPNEVIWFSNPPVLFNAVTLPASAPSVEINLESYSNGWIGKDIKAVTIMGTVRNSLVSGQLLRIGADSARHIVVTPQVADVDVPINGTTGATGSGNIRIYNNNSSTFSAFTLSVIAIQT
jgi:hypothetical protein